MGNESLCPPFPPKKPFIQSQLRRIQRARPKSKRHSGQTPFEVLARHDFWSPIRQPARMESREGSHRVRMHVRNFSPVIVKKACRHASFERQQQELIELDRTERIGFDFTQPFEDDGVGLLRQPASDAAAGQGVEFELPSNALFRSHPSERRPEQVQRQAHPSASCPSCQRFAPWFWNQGRFGRMSSRLAAARTVGRLTACKAP